MKVCATLLITSIWICLLQNTTGDYRHKLRGPPRPPPPPQYTKKRIHIPRPPVRPRPIPVHMPPAFKVPMGAPAGPRPVSVPVRNFWKSTQNQFLAPIEKPFISVPLSTSSEYDYHIQTNNIPMHSNTIKQVGEKGPIHTIPAPNLSLADKPIVVEEVRSQSQVHPNSLVQIQKSHQYQVTEEPVKDQYRIHNNYYVPESNLQVQSFSSKLNGLGSAEIPPDDLYDTIPSVQLSPQEVYHLMNVYPQHQMVDSYGMPLQQSQVPNYQQLLAQIQVPQKQSQVAEQSVNQPQFQTFNYEEQARENVLTGGLASHVNTDYNLEPQADTLHSVVVRNPSGALTQNYYAHHIFEENIANNNVEDSNQTDIQIGISTNFGSDRNDDEDPPSFYSTLPNRQAAETLASLQAAGKLNSNLLKIANQQSQVVEVVDKKPMQIYVSDEQFEDVESPTESSGNEKYSNYKKHYAPTEEDNTETYIEEIFNEQEEGPGTQQNHNLYGNRINPKRN